MKCQEFEQNLASLVYARLMDAAARNAARHHADECGPCAGRLRRERTLHAALRTTARADIEQAPAHLKTALMAAFAQQHAAPLVAAPVVSLAEVRQKRLTQRWLWAVAAALAVCALVGLTARPWTVTPEVSEVAQTQMVAPVSNPVEKPAEVTPAAAPKPQAKATRPAVAVQRVALKATPKPVVAPQTVRTVRPAPRAQPAMPVTEETPTELVTEYIPLTYVTAPTAMESGQVVRITMPRSSAIALGLPAHLEQREETIKADVVLSDDGLARQIRFVYQPDGNNRRMNR